MIRGNFFSLAFLFYFLVAESNTGFAFDYLESVNKCISSKPKQNLIGETRYLDRDIATGLKDELEDEIRAINRDVRDGHFSQAEASEFIRDLSQEYQQDIAESHSFYGTQLETLSRLNDTSICIYKIFLRSDTFNNPGILSRLFNGSPDSISESLVDKFGADNFQLALTLKSWCDETRNSLCYFNY